MAVGPDNWNTTMGIFPFLAAHPSYVGEYAWNDPDFLMTGVSVMGWSDTVCRAAAARTKCAVDLSHVLFCWLLDQGAGCDSLTPGERCPGK